MLSELLNKEFLSQYFAHFRVFLDYMHAFFNSGFYVILYITMLFTLFFLALTFISVFFSKKKKEKEFVKSKAPFVTIQIPTRNELIALRCAECCLEFDYPKNRYEILIGDDSNNPSVSQKIDEFAEKHSDFVKVIRRKENIGFKPGNLQNMLGHSKGDILVIFDSDFTPKNDFLKRIVTPFIHDKEIAAVQARWNFNNFNQNLVTVLASTILYVFHHVTLSFMDRFNATSLCGSAEAVRKKDLVALGGWKLGSLTEDIEYTLRLYKANKKFVYLQDLECYSEVPYTAVDFYKQQMRWAYGVVTSYIAHFKDIMLSKTVPLDRKILSIMPGFGYIVSPLIVMLFAFGTLSFVTHRPGPLDLPRFFSETFTNIGLTSGLLIASIVALYKEKKLKYVWNMVLSSFSIGLVATYYVNKGIMKSCAGKPMQWFLLNKNVQYKKE